MVSNLANDVFFHSAVINQKKKKKQRLLVLNFIIISWPILPASVSDLHKEQAICFPVGKMSLFAKDALRNLQRPILMLREILNY